MKTKLTTLICVLAMTLGSSTSAVAGDNSAEVIADVALVRPACLVATVIGSAIFVVALPIALTSRSVKKTGRTLVVNPAKATFTRPLGDYSSLQD